MFNFLCGDLSDRFYTDYPFFWIPRIHRYVDDDLYVHFKWLVETNEVRGVKFGDLLMDGDSVLFSALLLEDAGARVGSYEWIWFRVSIKQVRQVPKRWESISAHGWRRSGERLYEPVLHIEVCSEIDQYYGRRPPINEYGNPEGVYAGLLEFLDNARTIRNIY